MTMELGPWNGTIPGTNCVHIGFKDTIGGELILLDEVPYSSRIIKHRVEKFTAGMIST